MKHCSFFLFFFCLPVFPLLAQKNVAGLDYAKYSKEVREEVWNWNLPEFSNYMIPEEYTEASSIILAEHYDIELMAKRRFNAYAFFVSAPISNQVLYYTNTMRRMLKLNDKSSVEKYSELMFQEYFAKQGLWTKAASMTVVGVRIIKPDGTIRELDIDDEVSMEGPKNNRLRKLAIADLQVGDIIDYFIHYTEQMDNKNVAPLFFVFKKASPIVSYSIYAKIDKRLTAEYRVLNGAPEFIVANDKDGNYNLTAKINNIPAVTNEKWISVARQFPMLSLVMLYNDSKNIFHPESARKAGVHRNVDYNKIVDDYKGYIRRYAELYNYKWDYYTPINNLVKKYKDTYPNYSKDSLACLIYYALQHYSMNDWDGKRIDVGTERNYYSWMNLVFIAKLSKILSFHGIKTNLLFVTSQYGPTLRNITHINDLDAFLVIPSAHPILLASLSAFSTVNRIPAINEGEQAVLFIPEDYKKDVFSLKGKHTIVTTPVSTAEQNTMIDEIQVTIDMVNPLELQFNRTSTQSGYFKEPYQRMLLLYEDYEAEHRKALAIEKTMFEEMADKRKTQALIQEYEAAFAEVRKNHKDNFEEEIKNAHDMKTKELISFNILSMGIPKQGADLKYNVQYTMEGLVRKAGINYTIDAGKLTGVPLRLEVKERERNIDMYMPYARKYESVISFVIPNGYEVDGIDNLQQDVINTCGKFMVKAAVDNNVLRIHLENEYYRSFEPAENWPQLLEIIDGADEFYNKNIMLRKIKVFGD